jgi:methylglutaconyl-CoA hydratase
MSEKTVLCEIDSQGVARVTLNRPDVRNAMNEVLIADLIETLERVAADNSARFMVLTGKGKGFCAGGDLNWMRRTADYDFQENYDDALRLGRLMRLLFEMPKPTVALVNGAAFGGGMGLVAGCDIAIAAEEAKFSLSEVKLGLIPATIAPYVVRAMGERNSRRYFISAEIFGGAEAYEMGFVHKVVPGGELATAGNAMIDQLLVGGPMAQAAAKEMVFRCAESPIGDEIEEWTSRRIAEVRATDEGKEGASAFLEKRKPRWAP